jgi:hypothetical protein
MSQPIKFEKQQLEAVLAEVSNELHAMLKSEAASLSKALPKDDPGEESEGSSGPAAPPEESSAPAPGPEASAPPEAPAPGPEASAPPMEGSAPPAEEAAAAPEGSPAHEGGEIEPAPSVEELQAEYSKLPPEDMKMHYLAVKAALMATMGAEQGAPPPGPEASAPMAPPPPAPPSAPEMGKAELEKVMSPTVVARMAANKAKAKAATPPPPPAPEPAAKKEFPHSPGSGGEMEHGKMTKNEGSEIEVLKAQLVAQDQALAGLAKAMEVVTTPIRKSAKGPSDLAYIAKTDEDKPSLSAGLTKKQVQDRLREKVREGKLSKGDREAVLAYSAGGLDVSKIEHLLAGA